MHAGAAVGFMAKSAPGWIVPALALLTLVAWERRWRELRRPELYAGLLLQALIIVPWIVTVLREPDGVHALRVMFLDNLAGRFSTMTSADGTAYSAGHQNWPGRYLVELPFSLLPWTFLVIAAARSAWIRFRTRTLSTPWRFAVAASVPFILLLSVASTARDIYAAPAIPGLSLLVALWALELDPPHGRFDRLALTATRTLVMVLAVVMTLAVILIAAANGSDVFGWIVAPVLIVILTQLCLLKARRLQLSGDDPGSVVSTVAAFAIATVLCSVSLFPSIDRWQDLSALGRAIHQDSEGKPLAVLQADETTVAMLDDSLRQPPLVVGAHKREASTAVSQWFCEHPADGRLVVMLPGHAPGEVSRLLGRFWRQTSPGDGDAASLERDGRATLLARYELPHGRRYAVMGPPASMSCNHEAPAVVAP
jgi:4-amino-4-deoxy-L-arabinose transferase-like glycosyltransferase